MLGPETLNSIVLMKFAFSANNLKLARSNVISDNTGDEEGQIYKDLKSRWNGCRNPFYCNLTYLWVKQDIQQQQNVFLSIKNWLEGVPPHGTDGGGNDV